MSECMFWFLPQEVRHIEHSETIMRKTLNEVCLKPRHSDFPILKVCELQQTLCIQWVFHHIPNFLWRVYTLVNERYKWKMNNYLKLYSRLIQQDLIDFPQIYLKSNITFCLISQKHFLANLPDIPYLTK